MKKRKTYEVSVINKTYSKTYSDQTKFYTSDTALELNFQLKEVEYDFDSAEIILLNVDDRSLVTRPVAKSAEGFTYELEDDIVAHYGEWKGQLKFNEGGEIYVSSPVVFRIENDLSNDRPPQLTDVNTWKNLREIADGLIADMRSELESITEQVSEIEGVESERQTAEQSRQSAELIRVENEKQRILTYDSLQENIDMIGKVKLVNDIDVSITANGDREITKKPELTQVDDNINNYLKNNIVTGDKYYISIEAKSKGESGLMFFYSAGGSGLHYVNAVTTDEYQLKSKIVTGLSNYALVRLANITGKPQATNLVYRKVYTINLTKTFGVGNEPTKETMDWIVKENGYFEELTLRRDDIQQYEINQLRKAVIALGGTI